MAGLFRVIWRLAVSDPLSGFFPAAVEAAAPELDARLQCDPVQFNKNSGEADSLLLFKAGATLAEAATP